MTEPPALTRARSSCNEQLPTLGTDSTQPSKGQVPTSSDQQDCVLEHVKSEELVPHQTDTGSATNKDEPNAPDLAGESNRRYLLVDDNLINLKVLSAFMAKLGQDYTLATNGKVAVDKYKENPAQFVGIMMDISMPVMDGLEATRWIRAHERENKLRAVPVLALTGLSSHETHREALESGVDVFLTKPVGFKTLRQTLQDLDLPLSTPQLLPQRTKPS
jgi:CheY-like chemotaxis protein